MESVVALPLVGSLVKVKSEPLQLVHSKYISLTEQDIYIVQYTYVFSYVL